MATPLQNNFLLSASTDRAQQHLFKLFQLSLHQSDIIHVHTLKRKAFQLLESFEFFVDEDMFLPELGIKTFQLCEFYKV